MIYVCVTAKDNATTIGLVLWKVRQVFTEFPREYQLLVADDGSTDATAEVLERYQHVLPMTVFRQDGPRGYAASVETLLRAALERSDRPKRDSAILVPPDFAISPDAIPALVRRLESGADVVIAESLDGNEPFGLRLLRRSTPWLLRPGVRVPGVRDLTSGFLALRLVTLKLALRDRAGALLESDGICARAELVARAAAEARQIAVVSVPSRPAAGSRTETSALALALQLFRTGRRLRIRAPGGGGPGIGAKLPGEQATS